MDRWDAAIHSGLPGVVGHRVDRGIFFLVYRSYIHGLNAWKHDASSAKVAC